MINKLEPKPNLYLHIDGDIPEDLNKGTLISLQRSTPMKIYNLGFQPAKSIPEIPRWFLQKYASFPFKILEPFAGGGTTIIESIKCGISIDWLDYHPLSRLICQVKTSIFSVTEVEEEITKILQSAYSHQKSPETIDFANKDFWFQQGVQEGLEILRYYILKSPKTIQPIMWLAFASTVRKTSNMNDGMILAARRSHIKEIPKLSRSDVFKYFQIYGNKTIDAVIEWQPLIETNIHLVKQLALADARTISGDIKYNAVVSSPPYINAIDYVWASKFELHWLGMVKSNQERLNLYSQEIGTERIPKQECKELSKTGYQLLDKLIEDIYLGKKYQASTGQNQLRARVVYKYFMDMQEHFQSCFSCLKTGGYYCFSIGDLSKICGVDIPVASILTEIACDIGFQEEFHFHLLLKNRKLNIPRNVNWASTIKHDTVVVLEKPFSLMDNG
ncbi:DNA methylase [Okeania sp. SIO2B3]|uniref:DNA methylase n=1 Tax=Okeania sp. SIO2B3 TaxID=2607784 RepID=UPI0025DA39D7|nr:DNA methylase [Okeania sp. SIO2B3]